MDNDGQRSKIKEKFCLEMNKTVVFVRNLPLYNDYKHYNVNILVVDKIYR